jgi:anti-anti-sigma factor
MGEAFDPEQFSIAIEPDRAGRRSVRVCGDLDLATAPGFVEEVSALLARPLDTIWVDLGMLTFIDSSGLRALSAIRTRAEERNVRLLLVSVPAQAQRVLELTDMAQLFEYAPDDSCG